MNSPGNDMRQGWLFGPRLRQALPAVAAVALLVLATACGSVETNPQTAFNPRSDYAIEGMNLFILVIILGVIIGVLVEIVLIITAIRYRRRAHDPLPPQIHGSTIIEVLWTTGPVIVVGAILFSRCR